MRRPTRQGQPRTGAYFFPLSLDAAGAIAMNEKVEAHHRLFYLAFVNNRGDGHAQFDAGDLSRLLKVDRKNVSKILKAAIDRDLIRSGSSTRCVLLPVGVQHHAYGVGEYAHDPCPHHRAKTKRHTPDTALSEFRRTEDMASVGKRHTEGMAFGGIAAGEGADPLMSSTHLRGHLAQARLDDARRAALGAESAFDHADFIPAEPPAEEDAV